MSTVDSRIFLVKVDVLRKGGVARMRRGVGRVAAEWRCGESVASVGVIAKLSTVDR